MEIRLSKINCAINFSFSYTNAYRKALNNILFISILFFLLLNNPFFASEKNSYIPKYSNPLTEPWRWQGYSELIGKGCRCMVEDNNGSLWFGVNDGVYRYDGINWKYFPLFKNSNIPVVSLCISSDNSIYAGTAKGVSVLQKDRWELVPLNLDLGDPLEHPYNKIPIIEARDKSI